MRRGRASLLLLAITSAACNAYQRARLDDITRHPERAVGSRYVWGLAAVVVVVVVIALVVLRASKRNDDR
jgi:uncharacterized membrane protein YidH (DUF202 family)